MTDFNDSILAQIIIHIQDNMKLNVGHIIHIGNNRFQISAENISFLSGYGFMAVFYIEDGKVKHDKPSAVVML